MMGETFTDEVNALMSSPSMTNPSSPFG